MPAASGHNGLAQGVEQAGADVALDDTDRADEECLGRGGGMRFSCVWRVNVIAIPLTLYIKRSFSIDTPKACTTPGKLGVEPIFPSDQLS